MAARMEIFGTIDIPLETLWEDPAGELALARKTLLGVPCREAGPQSHTHTHTPQQTL